MTYCVIPGCISPQNPDSAKFCSSCGYKLRLKDRYRALYPIGRGGFGRTFLAVDEDIPSQPHCVIKQFYLESQLRGVSQKAIELFHQEAVRLDELGKHPQIPSLLAHFEQNEQLYLIQEWIAGQTLSKELQQQQIYNEKQIWTLLQDILPVLEYIHQHQVIHRDIKPENIIRRDTSTKVNVAQSPGISYSSPTVPLSHNLFIQCQRNPRPLSSNKTQRLRPTASKQLVLIDFGIAKFLTDTANGQTGTVIGTPEYMAPEQIRGKAFPASDLYSLGVTCLHLLTGVPPLDMHDSLNDCWVWRDFLPSGKSVSKHLGKILDKLVQNTVKKRYQSADQVLQAMQRGLGGFPHSRFASRSAQLDLTSYPASDSSLC
ncbi:protein kinase domain-containing protein [Moorena producens]|uniref:protein kinase domain-containing protein n=1 Tax=Moorena producens TaxID=1155739 RepID=UPI003C714162